MAWKNDHKSGQWVDDKTGEILINAPTSGTGTAFDQKSIVKSVTSTTTTTYKKDEEPKNGEAPCPGHKDAALVLKKRINVWAGAANKTSEFPAKALILDLANRYTNGLRGEGIELPPELVSKRIVFDWPDMSKPYLFKDEWKILTDWLLEQDVVRKYGLYVACLEGHGRTGTALAILAHYFDEWNDNVDVVRMIRRKYCYKAVETATQIEYFEKMTGRKTKCVGSNVGNYTTGGHYTPEPCFKTVKGALADCLHTCTCKTKGHKEHWCDKCKWDWWVDKDGLWEKPSPGNKAENRSAVCTPGEHVVHVVDKDGNTRFTETFSPNGDSSVSFNKSTVNSCWDASPIALGSVNGECESSEDQHLCGVEKGHPGRHMCVLCGGVWDSRVRDAAEMLEMTGEIVSSEDPGNTCLAMGGMETDHVCLCTMEAGHEGENYLGMVHACSTCNKMFVEGEEND